MTTTCPCCGQPVVGERLMVDLGSNTVSFGTLTAQVQPVAAIIVKILARAYPETVGYERLIQAIWGQSEAPLGCREIVHVRVCHLRRRITGFPIEIVNVWGEGYRLVLPTADRVAA